jgi:transposase
MEVAVGLLTKCLPTLRVLAFERSAPGGDLAVVWLERGTSTNDLQVGVPAAVPTDEDQQGVVMHVIIGVDPHKASHQAVAVDEREGEISRISVRATKTQTERLLAWAAPFEKRTWAIEGADGMGYLLSQQLVAVGERVVDVPATLAARTRVLGASWACPQAFDHPTTARV